MIVMDASVWTSRFLPADAFHVVSRSWIAEAVNASSTLIAPTHMLAEVAGAIARRSNSVQLGYQAVQRILRIPTLQLVAINTETGAFAAEVAATYRLRGSDAIYVAVARQLRVPLVSWDRDQVARAAGFIRAYTPDNYPGQ